MCHQFFFKDKVFWFISSFEWLVLLFLCMCCDFLTEQKTLEPNTLVILKIRFPLLPGACSLVLMFFVSPWWRSACYINWRLSQVFPEPFPRHTLSLTYFPYICSCFWMSWCWMSASWKEKKQTMKGETKATKYLLSHFSRVQLCVTP